jgi:hypothetical protein
MKFLASASRWSCQTVFLTVMIIQRLFSATNIFILKRARGLTGFRLLPQYWGRILGSFFYGGVSPSKIGPIAPY